MNVLISRDKVRERNQIDAKKRNVQDFPHHPSSSSSYRVEKLVVVLPSVSRLVIGDHESAKAMHEIRKITSDQHRNSFSNPTRRSKLRRPEEREDVDSRSVLDPSSMSWVDIDSKEEQKRSQIAQEKARRRTNESQVAFAFPSLPLNREDRAHPSPFEPEVYR